MQALVCHLHHPPDLSYPPPFCISGGSRAVVIFSGDHLKANEIEAFVYSTLLATDY